MRNLAAVFLVFFAISYTHAQRRTPAPHTVHAMKTVYGKDALQKFAETAKAGIFFAAGTTSLHGWHETNNRQTGRDYFPAEKTRAFKASLFSFERSELIIALITALVILAGYGIYWYHVQSYREQAAIMERIRRSTDR